MMDEQSYYSSHGKLGLIGAEGQQKISQASVLVIGAGGLGCPCLMALAGAGVGTIGIADFDKVHISNLHRQPLYSFADAGKLKTVIAADFLRRYNPFIKIQSHATLVDEQNILSLLQQCDVVADCTDNFSTRYLVNDACVYLNKPLVYGAIHQTEGHVTVFNYQHSATLRCLFPKDDSESIASCAEIGAYNITTALIGNMMANEVVKIILQHPDVLAGKLFQADILKTSSLTIQYAKTESGRNKSRERFDNRNLHAEISPADLAGKMQHHQLVLIDVRETEEHELKNIGGVNIPLSVLHLVEELPFEPGDELVIYCQKGNRSKLAAAYLRQKGFSNVSSLHGGIELFTQFSSGNN